MRQYLVEKKGREILRCLKEKIVHIENHLINAERKSGLCEHESLYQQKE